MALDNILFNEHQSASEVLILKGKEKRFIRKME